MADFAWTSFYEAFASRLMEWRARPGDLFSAIRNMAGNNPLLHYLHFGNGTFWAARNHEIDPFTVMGIFNRGTTAAHRHELGSSLARLIGLEGLEPPLEFHGIPHLDPRKSIFDGNREMWDLMAAAIAGDENKGIVPDFAAAWDKAVNERGNALGLLSIGLFWARPYRFMAVDKISAPFIESRYGLRKPADKCQGSEYVGYLRALAAKLAGEGGSFPQIALAAWEGKHEGE